MTTRTGKCLCGAVSLSAEVSDPRLAVCHCTQCQRWTGGGPLISVRVDQVTFHDKATIREASVSEWGVRVFAATAARRFIGEWQMRP